MKKVKYSINGSNSLRYNVKQAMYIIDNIYRCNEEDNINEMLPSWYQAIRESIKTLEAIENKDRYIEWYIDIAYYLIEKMPVLTLNKMPPSLRNS